MGRRIDVNLLADLWAINDSTDPCDVNCELRADVLDCSTFKKRVKMVRSEDEVVDSGLWT